MKIIDSVLIVYQKEEKIVENRRCRRKSFFRLHPSINHKIIIIIIRRVSY